MQSVQKNETRPAAQKGFSLLEMIIVMAIALIVMAGAVLMVRGTLQTYKADQAANIVTTQLRNARQLAISQRRWVKVTFDSSIGAPDFAPHVSYQLTNVNSLGNNGRVVTLPLARTTQFTLFAGLPDTPMAFGNSSAIYLGGVAGGPPNMYFGPTGIFTSAPSTNNIINGTLFVGIPGQTFSARAVTILGATGRVRTYTWAGGSTGWRE